jgi:hypothetical protein
MPLASVGGNQIFGTIIKAKTAAYTVTVAEAGVLFTNEGATASVAFTLPAVTGVPIGTEYTFYGMSAYGMSVLSNGSSDNIVAKNDVAADSITCTTTSLMIGAAVRVIWSGTKWLSFSASVGPTYVVA